MKSGHVCTLLNLARPCLNTAMGELLATSLQAQDRGTKLTEEKLFCGDETAAAGSLGCSWNASKCPTARPVQC